jgi:hypothetical protein
MSIYQCISVYMHCVLICHCINVFVHWCIKGSLFNTSYSIHHMPNCGTLKYLGMTHLGIFCQEETKFQIVVIRIDFQGKNLLWWTFLKDMVTKYKFMFYKIYKSKASLNILTFVKSMWFGYFKIKKISSKRIF